MAAIGLKPEDSRDLRTLELGARRENDMLQNSPRATLLSFYIVLAIFEVRCWYT